MVVILDLGDGLTVEEQDEYNDAVATARRDCAHTWTVEDGLPPGVIVTVVTDIAPVNPREDYETYTVIGTRDHMGWTDRTPAGAALVRVLEEWYCVDDAHVVVPAQLRQQLGAVAVHTEWINGSCYWGVITRSDVLRTQGQPTTTEEVEAFLALDVNIAGAEILRQEFETFRAWSEGEVFVVHALHTPSGRTASLGEVYDSSDGFTYAREAAEDLVKEVTA